MTQPKISFFTAGPLIFLLAGLLLSGCGPSKGGFPGQDQTGRDTPHPDQPGGRERGSLFSGVKVFNGKSNKTTSAGIGVNSYLWRASLDTLAFMPLQSADPFGGVIISDWYQDPAAPGERFKVTVYILDHRLRADGIKVAVFKQMAAANGRWNDAALGADTASELENTILTRARQLRIDLIEQ